MIIAKAVMFVLASFSPSQIDDEELDLAQEVAVIEEGEIVDREFLFEEDLLLAEDEGLCDSDSEDL